MWIQSEKTPIFLFHKTYWDFFYRAASVTLGEICNRFHPNSVDVQDIRYFKFTFMSLLIKVEAGNSNF